MSDTETATAPVPGKFEAAGLYAMNEIQYPTKQPGQHILVQQSKPSLYIAYVWSKARGLWVGSDVIPVGSRPLLLQFLADRCPFDNITITDHPVDLERLTERGLERLDDFLAKERITLCPEGSPGRRDGWVVVDRTHGSEGGLSNSNRFEPIQLKERFLQRATPPNPTGQWNPNPRPHFPVLVRHDVAAREILSPRLWGIDGRPDLAGRQVDRELAIEAAVTEEADRRHKAGDPTPINAIRIEVGSRMEKEWERAA